jgi:8-oxo-dGTP diphosphatase
MNNISKTKQVRACAVDAVIVDDDYILLINRQHPPFENSFVLPGGFVDPGETTEQAVVREVKEETGYDIQITEFVGVYSDPNRDPRQNISIAYFCDVVGGAAVSSEEGPVSWVNLSDLKKSNLGFDHYKIIEDTLCIQLP